jgi:SAM-dependent methyltransferase
MADRYHQANRLRWDAGSASWAHRADTRGIWKECHLDPSLALRPSELKWLSDVAAKNVAVLGSGDNQVVFALSGMGAKVTSVDISEPQLDVARHRAAVLGLDIKPPNLDRFVQNRRTFRSGGEPLPHRPDAHALRCLPQLRKGRYRPAVPRVCHTRPLRSSEPTQSVKPVRRFVEIERR